jgi:DNA-binding response OmpR family regulator
MIFVKWASPRGIAAAGAHRALTEDYGLVVLDVMLPRIDGWEVLRQTRHLVPTARPAHLAPTCDGTRRWLR